MYGYDYIKNCSTGAVQYGAVLIRVQYSTSTSTHTGLSGADGRYEYSTRRVRYAPD